MADFSFGEGVKRFSLPEVVVDGAFEMADTWCAGFIGSEDDI